MKKTEYDKLRKLWYKKLADSGFEDIEYNDTDIKKPAVDIHRKIDAPGSAGNVTRYSKVVWEAKTDYYVMAEHFLNDHKFDNELDKIIWSYHCNGISARNIVKLLHDTEVTKTNRDKVWKTVKALSSIMFELYNVKK